MARFPLYTPSVLSMPGAVYSPFADQLRDHSGPLYPLHVGDTWLEPFAGARMEDLKVDQNPGMHRYADTRGVPQLVDAVVNKVRERNQLSCETENVLICAGATGALACAIGALLDPGDEVLILAPFWPLIRGIVQAFSGVPVEVPFYDRVTTEEEAIEALRARITPSTSALYVSSPSNPSGRVLPRAMLDAMAAFAREHDLWLLSDEVYEDIVYRGEHYSMARNAPERTLSVYSFSKAYGMAGNRVGYLVGPSEAIDQARKLATHLFYGAPTSGQLAAVRALSGGGQWQQDARAQYHEVAEEAARRLGVPPPEGSTFFFLDISSRLDERGVLGFLERCFEDGVLVAPGASSGSDYSQWIRICYTALPPERALEAISLLARHLS
jgi:aspartate/methionine/tyrosine aminotransferase